MVAHHLMQQKSLLSSQEVLYPNHQEHCSPMMKLHCRQSCGHQPCILLRMPASAAHNVAMHMERRERGREEGREEGREGGREGGRTERERGRGRDHVNVRVANTFSIVLVTSIVSI